MNDDILLVEIEKNQTQTFVKLKRSLNLPDQKKSWIEKKNSGNSAPQISIWKKNGIKNLPKRWEKVTRDDSDDFLD